MPLNWRGPSMPVSTPTAVARNAPAKPSKVVTTNPLGVFGPGIYEITAKLPGMDEKNIEVKVADGVLTIKGEKREEKEEKQKDYYLQERSFGSFERSFEVPETVETDKIEASFRKGVLTLTLPKKAEAQKPAKKIEVKTA